MDKSLENHEFSFKKLFVPLTNLKAIVFLVFTGLIVFSASLFNGFVADDGLQILQNQLVHSITNFPQFFFGSTFGSGDTTSLQGIYYKPLMTTFFSLIYSILGASAFYFHLFQLLLHICSSIFVFLFFQHFFRKPVSLFLAFIFLIHPINTEAVVYISALQDTMFFFFGMLGLLILANINEFSFKSISLIWVFLFLSLLSKETGVLFILISELFVFIYNRKIFKISSSVIVSALILYLILRFSAVGINFTHDKTFPFMQLSFMERAINIPKIIYYYLSTFFYPKDLAMTQNWVVTSISIKAFYLPLLVLIISCIAVFTLAKSYISDKKQLAVVIFFGIWIILGLVFHLQIIPLDQTVADRWFYFSLVGLLGLIGMAIHKLEVKLYKYNFKLVYISLGILIITILSVRTFVRTLDWKDGITLYTHDLKVLKENYVLENSLGFELFTIGKLNDALYHLKISHKLSPNWFLNLNNLGVVYSLRWEKEKKQLDFNNAEYYYLASIKSSNFPLAYENLTQLYDNKGDLKKAKGIVNKGLSIYPNDAKLLLFLSDIEYKVGNIENAKSAIIKSNNIQPTDDKIQWLLFLNQKELH